ncbi:MAG: hypothetical protein WCR95_02545 [Eubacteriales bacterium]
MNIKLEPHYGADVSTNKDTDDLRKSECLCLNCGNMANCRIAYKLYELCAGNDLALMVTRCKTFIKR